MILGFYMEVNLEMRIGQKIEENNFMDMMYYLQILKFTVELTIQNNCVIQLKNFILNNRTNNKVENLEWVTPKENVYHSYINGNRQFNKEVPKKTLLTDFQISQIDKLRELYTVNQLAKLFNIEYQSLKNIIHKKKQYERLDNQQPSNYNSIYN